MRVLVGCERSGIVRDAFLKRGHDAWSCDLMPSDSLNNQHFQDDIRKVLAQTSHHWDLLVAFPPCTHLCISGARWFKDKQKLQDEALLFIHFLMSAPINKICIENPVGIISTKIKKPSQIIQPWQFGHEETKKTCLWLKNLPRLIPTKIMGAEPQRTLIPTIENARRDGNLTASGQNKLGPSDNRAYLRAKTYSGIAQAMAEQWG